jgi:hypothetical protein
VTAQRCFEVLRELRSLEGMAVGLQQFLPVSQHAAQWQHVLTAIDDRCALLRGVLHFEDPATVATCELHLAREQQTAEHEGSNAITTYPTNEECSDAIRTSPRITIH